MPVLSKILNEFEIEGSVYFCEVMSPPWSLDFTKKKIASFHCPRRGNCRLSFEDKEFWLGPGDVAIVINDLSHSLDSGGVESDKQQNHDTFLLCGYFKFHHDFSHPLFDAFPPLLILREEEISKNNWLKANLDFLVHEATLCHPGTPHILNRMTEVLLIQFLRHFINVDHTQNNFVKALFDPHIGVALNLLHTDPAENWTIDKIAKKLGMSRSSFANRFTALTGTPLFTYLTELRMRKAAHLLRKTDFPVAVISEMVGYSSDASFNRVFKKFTGQSALSYRRNSYTRTGTDSDWASAKFLPVSFGEEE